MTRTTIHSDYIPDNAITGVKIAENSITAREIATNAITTLYVADDSVTADKLANSINTDIATGVTANTTANAALPKAGGTLTGALTTNGVINTGTSHNFALNTPNSLRINIDSNNSATDQIFVIGHNQTSVDNNNALMTILESGKVGIGTSSPSQALHVAGGGGSMILNDSTSWSYLRLKSPNANGGYIQFADADDDDVGQIFYYHGSGGDYMSFTTNAAERMRIDSSGRLGVGCTPTGFTAEIQANSGGNALKLRGRNASENAGWLAWTDYAGNVEAAMYATANQLIFANTTSYTETMRIDGSGNVTIPGAITTGSSNSTPGQIIINDGGSSAYTLKIYGTGTRAYEFRGSDSGADYNTTFSNHDTGNHNLIVDGSITSTTNAALALDLAGTHSNGNYMRFAKGGAVQHYIGSSDSVGGGSGYYDYYSIANIGQRFWTGATERMRINSSGCVGIGSTADRSIGTNITTTVINGSVGGGLWLSGGNSSATSSLLYSFVNGSVGRLIINQGKGVGGGDIDFTFNENAAPKVRFTTGHLHFGGHTGEASGSTGGITMSDDSNDRMNLICATTTTGGVELIEFRNPNGTVGYIATNGSSTAYNTSSDYRLKENVNYTWDATTRLKQLKPARFNFKTDTDTTVDGFLAHEVQSIVPEAITGEKDGEKMQAIDQSKLVPLLVKTIQELEARIATLEG